MGITRLAPTLALFLALQIPSGIAGIYDIPALRRVAVVAHRGRCQLSMSLQRGMTVRELGEGLLGGRVLSIEGPDGSTRVEKHYSRVESY